MITGGIRARAELLSISCLGVHHRRDILLPRVGLSDGCLQTDRLNWKSLTGPTRRVKIGDR